MKTILVDARNTFVLESWVNKEMEKMLESFSNTKIILTNANEEEQEKFWMKSLPYDLFTIAHHPNKTNPQYYSTMLEHYHLTADDVIYFEHNPDAVESAKSIGIKTFWYDPEKKDLPALQKFLEANV